MHINNPDVYGRGCAQFPLLRLATPPRNTVLLDWQLATFSLTWLEAAAMFYPITKSAPALADWHCLCQVWIAPKPSRKFRLFMKFRESQSYTDGELSISSPFDKVCKASGSDPNEACFERKIYVNSQPQRSLTREPSRSVANSSWSVATRQPEVQQFV